MTLHTGLAWFCYTIILYVIALYSMVCDYVSLLGFVVCFTRAHFFQASLYGYKYAKNQWCMSVTLKVLSAH